MYRFKKAFTMIEMIFVIVILGILAAIAVPKLAATRTDATITKGRADIASIRSGIITERQGRLLTGDSSWIDKSDLDVTNLFDGVLMYGVTASSSNDGWNKVEDGKYTYKISNTATTFIYDDSNGKFTCTAGSNDCDNLTN